jgi:hypothetical protein
LIYIKGAVPGALNGFLTIQAKGDLQVNLKAAQAKVEEAPEIAETPENTEAKPEETVSPEAVSEEVKPDSAS